MPFTLSHILVAPPLARLTGHRIPVAAIAIGAMTPDLYRLFTQADYDFPHQWQAIYSVDLAMGLFFSALWYLLYRPVLYRFINMTDPLQINTFSAYCRFICMLCIGLMIGTTTHLIWDGLTHLDFRTFAFADILGQQVILANHQYPMHRVLQIGSSIVALPAVVWMGIHYYHQHRQKSKLNPGIKYFAIALGIISLLIGYAAYFDYAQAHLIDAERLDLYSFIGRSINQFTTASLISFSLGCLIFLILDWCSFWGGAPTKISIK